MFEESSISISDKGLLLGVRDKNVEYMMNEKAGVLAFVQEGDLWSYSPDDGKFSRIFSFRKETDGDFRDSRYQHNIKIIRVEDNGMGMEQEQAEKLITYQAKGYGLKNVNDRMCILYGED